MPPHLKSQLGRRIWRMAYLNRMCQILKEIWNWMVWKLQMSCKKTLWRNKPLKKPRKTQTNLSPLTKARSLSKPVSSTQTKKTEQAQNNTNSAGNRNNNNSGGQANSNSHKKISNSTNANNINNQKDLSTHLVRPVVKLTIPQRKVILE